MFGWANFCNVIVFEPRLSLFQQKDIRKDILFCCKSKEEPLPRGAGSRLRFASVGAEQTSPGRLAPVYRSHNQKVSIGCLPSFYLPKRVKLWLHRQYLFGVMVELPVAEKSYGTGQHKKSQKKDGGFVIGVTQRISTGHRQENGW